ncbi:MAG: GGDEF domain-containing protein [Cycloclasticus sp.]|nr:GGDEF domain-containing protein [Cycloclasticus sp.]MBQ0790863.1 GGDEF domain-containing protein [Cycloclasticus sp.]
MTTDYKEKYLRAVKALDEVEQEGTDNIQSLYAALMSVLRELRGHHKEIDKAIASLPKKIARDALPPINDLDRVKDLVVSYIDKNPAENMAPAVLDALLSSLLVLEDVRNDIVSLQQKLVQANSPKDFMALASKISRLILKKNKIQSGSIAEDDSIDDIKQSISTQLDQLGQSDAELAKSIDIVGLKKSLKKVGSLRDLEFFYRQVFEGLGQRLSKKDEFIVELSGLIETVMHQLTELSQDLKKEGASNKQAKEDRWRLTELMGGQIKTIRSAVLQADSLVTLKSMMSERIVNLNKTVSEFVELESERSKQAEAHAKSVTTKLNKVESEVSELKSSLYHAHEQAFIDVLTGVANRRAYEERIKLEHKRWQRNKEPLALAVLDIDHFKSINDTYGHSVGDKVLRTISQLIDKKVRESDFFGRVGGEEFVVVFIGSDLENAMKRLEQFRKSVENCKFGLKGKRVVITMSVGCALFHEGETPDAVYERADTALYQAKKTGRNKCLSELDI